MEITGDMNELCLVGDGSRRQYALPEKAVAEFNSRPPERRMATLGWPKDGQGMEELRCGTIDALQDICGRVNASITIDPRLPGGKELKALVEGGKTLTCGLHGRGHYEDEVAVMDSIEYVAIGEAQGVPR